MPHWESKQALEPPSRTHLVEPASMGDVAHSDLQMRIRLRLRCATLRFCGSQDEADVSTEQCGLAAPLDIVIVERVAFRRPRVHA